MPIYAYKCSSCGLAKDVLQKISDAPLSDCPSCGQSAFEKQVTAAGFQLKGTGWYVTDFRGGKTEASPASDTAVAPKTDSGASATAPAGPESTQQVVSTPAAAPSTAPATAAAASASPAASA